ncbi:MAG: hypothetical protein L0Y54_12570, partial [Sporichthyaceae bacterium]|nr:hypothetical protein [Sporichthyaceae bacterium]
WPVRGSAGIMHERMVLLASGDLSAAGPPPGDRGLRLRDPVLKAFNSLQPDRDPNPTLSRALLAVGADIVADRTREG